MRAYRYDDLESDQREEHDSGTFVSIDDLESLGVLVHHCPSMSDVDRIATQRNYKNRDEIIISPQQMGNVYEEKVKLFFQEHLHEDEEIRYILDGEGYFDIRNVDDNWVRIKLGKGDLLILPPGIYHRFTPDRNDYLKAIRLFQDEPKWKPLRRKPDVDANPHREQYLSSQGLKAGAT